MKVFYYKIPLHFFKSKTLRKSIFFPISTGNSYGTGGWYGDPEGHSRAAKKVGDIDDNNIIPKKIGNSIRLL